jgi:hypothetical protein
MEISIPVKLYCFMAARILKADTKINKKILSFLALSWLWKTGITFTLIEVQTLLYVHSKANKMSFPIICCNIFITAMFQGHKFDLWPYI